MIEVNAPGKTVVAVGTDAIKILNITAGVGLVVMDPVKKVGVGAHIVLAPLIAKTMTALLASMESHGCAKTGLVAKMCGGSDFLGSDMGTKLSREVTSSCLSLGVKVSGQDLGGQEKRTMVSTMSNFETKVLRQNGEKTI